MNDLSTSLLLQMHEQQTEMAGTLGRIEAKLDANDERVSKIEKAATRQWWYTMAIGPALALAHEVARAMGFKV